MVQVEILPKSKDVLSEQRELGRTHTAFEKEYVLYRAIAQGDVKAVEESISNYLKDGLVVGRLSSNTLRQMKYWAVACISIAIHYAILGGLDETDAYNLSDEYIQHIDEEQSMEKCIIYLKEKAMELTTAVNRSKTKSKYSTLIKKCIHYIHIHLHERLKEEDVADNLGVSKDYLMRTFKKETGTTLHQYILQEKLETSKLLLQEGKSFESITYQLCFASEAHYITCFKKMYGMTPGKYRKSIQIQS